MNCQSIVGFAVERGVRMYRASPVIATRDADRIYWRPSPSDNSTCVAVRRAKRRALSDSDHRYHWPRQWCHRPRTLTATMPPPPPPPSPPAPPPPPASSPPPPPPHAYPRRYLQRWRKQHVWARARARLQIIVLLCCVTNCNNYVDGLRR